MFENNSDRWTYLVESITKGLESLVGKMNKTSPADLDDKGQNQWLNKANKAFNLIEKIRKAEERRQYWRVRIKKALGEFANELALTESVREYVEGPKSRRNRKEKYLPVDPATRKLCDEVFEEFNRYPKELYENYVPPNGNAAGNFK